MAPENVLTNEVVRKNVEIFKIILKRVSQLYETGSKADKTTQSVLVFLHRMRGEIRFFDHYAETLDPGEWTCVRFQFSPSDLSQESFSLDISNVNEKHFCWEDLQPEAFSNLKETINTIRFISKFLPKLKNFSAVLKEFSLTNVDTLFTPSPTQDIVHEAWHDLTRNECEALLLSRPKGTFLFRKDEFATVLEEQLSFTHKQKIRCITLSYHAPKNKVSDLTLVQNRKEWLVYNDDPALEEEGYPTLNSLLDSLRGVLGTPLIHK